MHGQLNAWCLAVLPADLLHTKLFHLHQEKNRTARHWHWWATETLDPAIGRPLLSPPRRLTSSHKRQLSLSLSYYDYDDADYYYYYYYYYSFSDDGRVGRTDNSDKSVDFLSVSVESVPIERVVERWSSSECLPGLDSFNDQSYMNDQQVSW